MNKLFYPAIFQKEDIGYSVWLHDIPGCISQGDTLEEAMANISDAIGLYFEHYKAEGQTAPPATNPAKVPLESGQFVALIEFDWLAYQKRHHAKAVKKTLTIPAWLNTMAEEQHINFSSVLQSALKEKLNIHP